jgi:hypothetical protein
MSRKTNKILLVLIWILIVFGYLWVFQLIYEKNRSFYLFVLLALSGNLSYDGLKKIIYYDPLYPSDSTMVLKYALGFVFFLFSSIIPLILGAALIHWDLVNFRIGQAIGTIGFLFSIVLGMVFLAKAESRFKLSNKV